MHNKLTMRTLGYFILGAVILAISLTSCSNKSGPDQTLNVPNANFTISEHAPGDLGYSTWTLTSSDGTLIDVASYVLSDVSKEMKTQLDSYRSAMLTESQNVPVLTRYWSAGEFKISRNFIPLDPTDIEHGAVNMLAESPKRVFTLLFKNQKMKQAQLVDIAEKTTMDLVKTNPK